MMIIKYRVFFFWLTGLILAAALGSLLFFGIPLSQEFTGGSLIEVRYETERPALSSLQEALVPLSLGEISMRESGDAGAVLRTRTLAPAEHDAILAALGSPTELRYTSIGPSLGNELAIKAVWALLAVTFAIVLYIAWVFRKVSRPVPSWGYGLIVVLMLAIDVIVPAGFFAAYAHFTGAEAGTLVVVALLALLGYCVNDVIVIFDRVREHLKRNEEEEYEESFDVTIGKSIDETIVRSVNTSLTVALALLAILVFGSEATRDFALVMLVGVIVGTFSSIARSAPLLIPIARMFPQKEEKKA